MAIPKNKDELLKAIVNNYKKLTTALQKLHCFELDIYAYNCENSLTKQDRYKIHKLFISLKVSKTKIMFEQLTPEKRI